MTTRANKRGFHLHLTSRFVSANMRRVWSPSLNPITDLKL